MNELANEEPTVEVRSLSRDYGAFQAVKQVSFRVHRGEVFGLLGTNGAGKTSTLEVLEGLAPASSGIVRIFGKDPHKDKADVRSRMGIMLQAGGLPTQLTVTETIKMWQGTCSHPIGHEQILTDVGLMHRLDVKVGNLSGGEQRRLDLACALVGNPQLLFLDEPTTGLDPESRRNVWALLQRLKRRGVTMILTTHYLEEAEVLCDRIAIMHGGSIACSGTLSEIVKTVPGEIKITSSQAPPPLSGTVVASNGNQHTVSTRDLPQDTLTILEWARDNNFNLENFAARPASLETVFMGIAGNQTRII